ncbi:hypothetical protein HD554DRAFT_1763288 [Boletus coccyginus]|nr:hypothetical protein HD554DRAFT_1763288 [Boletus coccyginus]
MKVPSIEPTPQSGGGYNGSSVLPRSSVRESEEADSVRQDAPQTLEVVNPEINNLVDPITKISPLAADTSHLPSPQGACDPTVLASWPVSSAENPVVEEVRIQAAQVLQGVAVEAEDRPVELDTRPVDSDGPFHAQSTGEPSNIVQVDVADNNSQGTAEIVAIPPTPETVAFVAATLVAQPAVVAAADGEAPEPTVEGLHVAKQSSRKASADPVAAFTLESVGHHEIDDLSPVSANEVIASETGAHLEPPSVTSVLDVIEGEEVAELAEAPTQSPEHVAPVEETPDQEASVDVGRAGAAQVPVAKSEVLDGAALELEVLDGAASQAIAAELEAALKVEPSSVTHPVEEHSSEVVPAVATIAQIVVVETEHAADQVSELATEEARPHVEDTLIQAAEAPLVETCPVLEAEADVSPGTVSASQQIEDVALAEVETQAATETLVHEDCIVEIQDQGAPAPVPEHVVLVDETSDPEIATEVHETADVGPVITPEFKEVQDETRDPVVEAVVEAKTPPVVSVPLTEEAQPSSEAELPTQVHDTLDGVVLSTGSNAEVATAALATVDEEAIAAKADAQSTSDSPAGDAEAHAHVPENAPVEDTLEIATETSQPVEGVPSTATDQPIENKVAVAIAEEAQGFMREAEPPASEPVAIAPVAQDAQAPIEIEQPSSESVPQSVDEAASPPIVALSVPEEIINVQVEAQQEPEVVHPATDTFDGSLADHDAEPAPLAPELGVPVELTVDEEAANPPITSVSVPEETVTVRVEAQPEPEVVHPAVDTVDVSLVDDAERAPLAPELGVPVELAVDEEAANPPTVSVSVPQEVNAIQVEAQPEPEVVHPTVDTVDDAEPAPLAPELGVPVEETEVVVDTSEPETLAAEPEFVEVRAPIPVVEDVQAPVEAEESFPVVVEVSEEVVASQPEGKSG